MNTWIVGHISGITRKFCVANEIVTNLANERSLGLRLGVKVDPISLITPNYY